MIASRHDRLAALALPALLASLLISGIGSASAAGVATLESPGPNATPAPSAGAVDPKQAALDYTQCMRDNGIDMPDPVFTDGGQGGGQVVTIGGDVADAPKGDGGVIAIDPAMQAAQEECNHFLTASAPVIDPQRLQEMQDQMLVFAQCMRDHGVDVPDPQVTSNGGAVSADFSMVGTDTDAYQAARHVCGVDTGGQPVEVGSGEGPAPSTQP